MTEYLVYTGVRLLSKFLMILPAGLASYLGKVIGNFGYCFNRKHREIAYNNVKIAFGNEKNILEIKKIVRGSFQNFGQNLIELLRLPIVDSKYLKKFVKVEGKEFMDDAIRGKKGLVALAVHFGSWELSNTACANFGYPYMLIVKEQPKFKKLNDLLNSYRQINKCNIVTRAAPAGIGNQAREIIRGLQNNEIAVMVTDQGGRDGAAVKFFDRTASMHTGPLRLALKLGVPVIISFIVRETGYRHKLIFRPVDLKNSGNLDNDIKENLDKISQVTQQMIVKYPEQYLWSYKIWKYSNDRSVVILSDEKIGHLRQSEAVSKIISNELAAQGLNAQTKIIKIEFKNQFSRLVLSLSIRFLSFLCFCNRIGFLKAFLKKDAFNDLSVCAGDFVVSCGSSVAPINSILSKEIKAKNIVVMRPGMLNPKRFNLAIIPKHDNPPKGKNIAKTDGAPNLIDAEYLRAQSDLLIKRFVSLGSNRKKILGVLMGGDTKNYTLSPKFMSIIVEQLKSASEKLGLEIILTTSRRTPREVDNLLKENLENDSRCKLLVIANENNFPEAVGGILALSDIVIISSDSISMVSEAASSGKVVIVFRVQLKKNCKPNLRHRRFLDNLSKNGQIKLINPEEIAETLEDIAEKRTTTKILQDNQIITDAIRKVL